MIAKTPWKHRTMPSDLDETVDAFDDDVDDNELSMNGVATSTAVADSADDVSDCDESAYSIETLSTHVSDLVVRPIVNNRRVEPHGSAMDPIHDVK